MTERPMAISSRDQREEVGWFVPKLRVANLKIRSVLHGHDAMSEGDPKLWKISRSDERQVRCKCGPGKLRRPRKEPIPLPLKGKNPNKFEIDIDNGD